MPGAPFVASCYEIVRVFLVVMPFVTSSDALVTSSFLLLIVRPGATSSVLFLVTKASTCSETTSGKGHRDSNEAIGCYERGSWPY